MEILIEQHGDLVIATLPPGATPLQDGQDAGDLIMNSQYAGADGIVLLAAQLVPGFWALETGIAGEMLQKVSTYRSQWAIIGEFEGLGGKSLRAFILESNRAGRVRFVGSWAEALAGFRHA